MGTNTYEILSVEATGNDLDGYDLNAVYHTPFRVELAPDASDGEIVAACIEAEYLNPSVQGYVDVESDDSGSEFYLKRKATGKPLCHLRRKP